MEYFVKTDSVVRKIWSDADCILFIFGACAGEFALHKSVDWLFFTGKLPNDPIGRLFSTVAYAQKIIFEEKSKADQTLSMMKNIHVNVENSRGFTIPNLAYQDVLYMLIEYTISATELLNHTLSLADKEEIFEVFRRVGDKMGIRDLPENFEDWKNIRTKSLKTNYLRSNFSDQLFEAYRNNLGIVRNCIMLEVQKELLPIELKEIKPTEIHSFFKPAIIFYAKIRRFKPFSILKFVLLPKVHSKTLRTFHKAHFL